VLAVVNMVVSGLVGIDDQGSFYRAMIESRLPRGQAACRRTAIAA